MADGEVPNSPREVHPASHGRKCHVPLWVPFSLKGVTVSCPGSQTPKEGPQF